MIYLSALIFFLSSFTHKPALAPMRMTAVHFAVPSVLNKTLLLKLVNEARRTGVQCENVWHPPAPPLTWNVQLEAAALLHSADMYQKKYFSHIEGDGSTANTRIEKAGYNWMAYGENIGMGYTTEKDVIEAWLKSPGHCKNIMSPNYKEMGVGRVGDYWTQDFASR